MSYFIPHNNWLYRTIMPLSGAKRYLLTIFLLTILLGVWYCAIYCPINKNIQYYTATIKEGHKKNRELEECTLSCNQTKKTITQLEETVQNYSHKKGVPFFDTIKELFGKAGASGLSIEGYSVTKGAMAKKEFTKECIQLQAHGSFEAIIAFFKQLKESKKLNSYKRISLEKQDNNLYKMQLEIVLVQLVTP